MQAVSHVAGLEAAMQDMHVMLAIWTCWPLVPGLADSHIQGQAESRPAEQPGDLQLEAGDSSHTAADLHKIEGVQEQSPGQDLASSCQLRLEAVQSSSWPLCMVDLHADLLEASRPRAAVSEASSCRALCLLRQL